MSTVILTAFQLAQIAVLGRLLSPEAFGLMALVLVAVGLGETVGRMGLVEAVVSRKHVSAGEFSSLYWFNVVWGGIVYLGLAAAAPAIAAVFGEPDLAPMLPVALLSVAMAPFGALFLAEAQKQLKFGIIAAVEIAAAAAGLVVAVVSAWIWDQGAWSLVWGHLARSGVLAGGFAVSGWLSGVRPHLRFDAAGLRPFLAFGMYRVGAMGVNFLTSRTDRMLIGALLGTEALGYYTIAATIVFMPIEKLNPIVTRVAFPVLARMHGDTARQKAAFLLMQRGLASVNFPVFFGLIAVAPWLVPVLLGEGWLPAAALIQILSGVALLRSIANAAGALIMARGRADLTFKWNVALAAVGIPVVALAAYAGTIFDVAWALLGVQILALWPSYRYLVRSQLGPCLPGYAGSVTPALGLSALMAGATLTLVELGGAPSLPALGAVILSGAAVYAGLYYLLQRRQFVYFAGLLLRTGKRMPA